jgi:hypothetical protein
MKTRYVGHIAFKREMRNAYKILDGNLERSHHLEVLVLSGIRQYRFD